MVPNADYQALLSSYSLSATCLQMGGELARELADLAPGMSNKNEVFFWCWPAGHEHITITALKKSL